MRRRLNGSDDRAARMDAARAALDAATEWEGDDPPPRPPRSKSNGARPSSLTLQELLDRAETDPSSVFESDAVELLAHLLRDDRAAFERARDQLKKYGVRTGDLMKLVTAAAASAEQDDHKGNDDDVDALIDQMNEQWAVMKVGGKVAVMTEETDSDLGSERTTQSFLKAIDFKLLLKNQTVRVLGSNGKPEKCLDCRCVARAQGPVDVQQDRHVPAAAQGARWALQPVARLGYHAKARQMAAAT